MPRPPGQQPGVSVAATALAHGLNANLLRKGNTMALGRRTSGHSTDAVLLPVRTEPGSVPAPLPADGYVEIVVAAGDTSWSYDNLGRRTYESRPDGTSTAWT